MNMLKKKLSEKLGKNGGFTLVEMLIVVAIIAILIAVSIPLVSNALEKARDATDQANERAAKAEVLLVFLSGGKIYDNGTAATGTDVSAATAFGSDADTIKVVYYDATSGRLTTGEPSGYGQCTGTGHYTSLGTPGTGGNAGLKLKVSCSSDGIVGLAWV